MKIRFLEKVLKCSAALAFFYLVCGTLLFDHRSPSFVMGIESINGKSAVVGPRPWFWVVRPEMHNFYYSGKEAPFVIYRWYCVLWAKANGYEIVP